jgi:hypothetical protein
MLRVNLDVREGAGEGVMEKKIAVPEGMLKAAWASLGNEWHLKEYTRIALEVGLRWLSENPIVPTPEQALEMATGGKFDHFDNWELVRWGSSEWQRRCFLAPEPKCGCLNLQLMSDRTEGMRLYYRCYECGRLFNLKEARDRLFSERGIPIPNPDPLRNDPPLPDYLRVPIDVCRAAQKLMNSAPEPEVPKSEREIIDAWLKRHQPNSALRVSVVGDAMASELLRELKAYRRGRASK